MIGAFISRMRKARAAAAGFAGALGLAAALSGSAANAEPIQGGGSTFAAPIINQWSRSYEARRTDGGDYTSPDWRVDYEPVGSLAGVMRLSQPETDFAATDAPLTPEEIARRGWTQFPVVMGGIVVIANLDGVGAGQLRLSGALLADIYLGRVRNWSDAAIKALNPELSLPDAAIEALHREDGSGSTLVFTSFLSRASSQWREKVGADTLVAWPVGRGEKGTGALAARAAATRNSIAYVEFGQAVRTGLPLAALPNRAGAFVRPEPAAFRASLAAIGWDPARHFHVEPGEQPDAYPMTAITYVVLPKDRSRARIARVLDLFRLAYGQNPEAAMALGYIPVSPELSRQIEAYWASNFGAASR